MTSYYCCWKRRKCFRIFIVLLGIDLLVEIAYDIRITTTTLTTTNNYKNHESIFFQPPQRQQPQQQPQPQPLRIIHPITNTVIPYYHALWNFSTHSIQIKQPNLNENDPHPHHPQRPTSLEILQQILHDEQSTETSSSSPSCFKANIQQTQQLVNEYSFNTNMNNNDSGILQHQQQQQQLSFPILNMGFPKCGTTTLLQFFKCTSRITSFTTASNTTNNFMSINARHGAEGNCMKQAIENGNLPISGCMKERKKNYQYIPIHTLALLQMDYNYPTKTGDGGCIFPQISFLDEIHNEVPNATFILPFRPIHDWIKSTRNQVVDWVHRWDQCITTIPGLVVGSNVRKEEEGNDKVGGNINDHNNDGSSNNRNHSHTTLLTDNDLSNWWCSHVKHIREFVKQYPSHKLIELDLYDTKVTSTIMAQLFHSHKSCWGHANSTPNKKKRVNK